MAKEKPYKIVAVLWEDHIQVTRSDIPKNPHDVLNKPSLSIGILAKETDKCVMLISDIERYPEHDDGNYIVIYKTSIVGIKEFGEIPLRIRFAS